MIGFLQRGKNRVTTVLRLHGEPVLSNGVGSRLGFFGVATLSPMSLRISCLYLRGLYISNHALDRQKEVPHD